MESLERLQGLHADLITFSQSSVAHIERLLDELKASINDFRGLLDKTKSTADETNAYNSGKIEVGGLEYSINEDFRHLSNAIASSLQISEEQAGRLIIETQVSGADDEQAIIADVVRKYHDRRDYLLQDLRLLLAHSRDAELDDLSKIELNQIVAEVLGTKHGAPPNGSSFANRCLQTMGDIEAWQTKLNEALQSKAVLSQARGEAFYNTIEFQRSSLFKQHEALGAILALLFRGNHTTIQDLRTLHSKSKSWHRLDFSYVHYLPAFSSAFQHYGSPDRGDVQSVQSLNRLLVSGAVDGPQAALRPLIATLEMWWTADFSANYANSAAPDPNAASRAHTMKTALEDGALDFMLSVCTNMKGENWQQIARQELVAMLLDGSNIPFEGVEQTSPYFVTMMMEAYEAFADSWISNMPDSIRKLKADEDDRRLLQITATADGALQRPPRDQGVRLYLEAFLVVMAFAYEGRPELAEHFWSDKEGNLYGFLQWASRRQTVPRVSAFCEMLCAISQSAQDAHNAHEFLLEDAAPTPGMRGKKFPSMSYQQIFAELDFYSKKVHEKIQQSQIAKTRSNPEPELNEAESPVMLCCYLRLLGHLFQHTPEARRYVLDMSEFDFLKSILILSSGPIPSYLRAAIFTFFEALLTDKAEATSDRVWSTIEDWASTNHDRVVSSSNDKQPQPTATALQNTLSAVSASYDQYDAFVKLLSALIMPLPQNSGQPLPFPADLGTNYRTPGITPYLDFVCIQLTPKNVQSWLEDGNTHGTLRLINIIGFMTSCLVGFNETYIYDMHKPPTSGIQQDNYALMYLLRHPFSRVMQWIFSTNVNRCLLDVLHHLSANVTSISLEDPKTTCLNHLLELLIAILNLQPTYFDIVKPRMKPDGYKIIQYSGIVAIEDSIIARPLLLLDVCKTIASEHVPLCLASLEFLQKLSESARFQNHLFDETSLDRKARRMIEMVGPDGELKLGHISSSLAPYFNVDDRELEAGHESDGYLLKDAVVSFFNACLATQSDSPNIAHVLLGFQRVGARLATGRDFDQGTSTLDALAALSINYPDGLADDMLWWLLHIKAESICVLKHLWSFPVSADLTMNQLRRADYLTQQIANQSVVAQSSLWNGKRIHDPEFYFHTSAEAFTSFLSFRMHLFDYVTREVQQVAQHQIKALQGKYLLALQGKSSDLDGTLTNHATVFDLFDFAELDAGPPDSLRIMPLEYFYTIDFESYQREPLYDVNRVQLVLRTRSGQIVDEYNAAGKGLDAEHLQKESDKIVALLEARNRCVIAQAERVSCLKSYVDMIISIVDCVPMEAATKTQFVLHVLQLVLPKLDTYLSDGTQEVVELTRLADTLLVALSNTQVPPKQTRIDISIAEKLFQLFRICAEGAPLSTTNPDLRTVLYSICAQYLARLLTLDTPHLESSKKARGNAMDTVRSAGTQLFNILTDDADDGLDACRLNALSFLAQLVNLARSQNSNLIVDSFVKSNVLEVLLDPIKSIAEEFRTTDPGNRSHTLALFTARTILLLQVSRTHRGASALLDAGLIQTLRDSGLFAADPDLGFDLNPADPTALVRSTNLRGTATTSSTPHKTALTTYFTLLSSCLRLLLSTFLSFGPENEKIIYLVRTFLSNYRGNMVGVYKRAAGLNLASQQAQGNNSIFGITNGGSAMDKQDKEMARLVDECMKAYTGLAVGSGFLEFEEERGLEGNGIGIGAGGGTRGYFQGGGFT